MIKCVYVSTKIILFIAFSKNYKFEMFWKCYKNVTIANTGFALAETFWECFINGKWVNHTHAPGDPNEVFDGFCSRIGGVMHSLQLREVLISQPWQFFGLSPKLVLKHLIHGSVNKIYKTFCKQKCIVWIKISSSKESDHFHSHHAFYSHNLPISLNCNFKPVLQWNWLKNSAE